MWLSWAWTPESFMKKAKDQQAGFIASPSFWPAVVCVQYQMFASSIGHRKGDQVPLQYLMNLLKHPIFLMLQVSRDKSSMGPLVLMPHPWTWSILLASFLFSSLLPLGEAQEVGHPFSCPSRFLISFSFQYMKL